MRTSNTFKLSAQRLWLSWNVSDVGLSCGDCGASICIKRAWNSGVTVEPMLIANDKISSRVGTGGIVVAAGAPSVSTVSGSEPASEMNGGSALACNANSSRVNTGSITGCNLTALNGTSGIDDWKMSAASLARSGYSTWSTGVRLTFIMFFFI